MSRIAVSSLTLVVAAVAFRATTACAADAVSYPIESTQDLSSVYQSGTADKSSGEPLTLALGPHLFIDDYLIAASESVERRVNSPRRNPQHSDPIVTGGGDGGDGNTAPYLSVLKDQSTGQYRIWFNVLSNGETGGFGTMTSSDGVAWNRPTTVLANPGPITWGCSVLDDSARNPPADQRYKLCWWANGGSMLAASPDGINWKLLAPGPVVLHNHDINSLSYDPLRERYFLTMSAYVTGKTWPGTRRVTMQSSSPDLTAWDEPWLVLTPVTGVDEGETQFYAMEGYLTRGDLLIGMAKILRDDKNAEGVPDGGYGIGYTTLAWTRDGRHWVRDTTPFFEPNPEVGTWDHTHAWIDDQLLEGDKLRLYYGGYKNGHKFNRFVERQIGLVTIGRDRYVARAAGPDGGTMRTPIVRLEADEFTVNADIGGELRLRLLDKDGAPLPGFDFSDCSTIRGDSYEHKVAWAKPLVEVKGQAVSIEFQIKDGRVFGFDLTQAE